MRDRTGSGNAFLYTDGRDPLPGRRGFRRRRFHHPDRRYRGLCDPVRGNGFRCKCHVAASGFNIQGLGRFPFRARNRVIIPGFEKKTRRCIPATLPQGTRTASRFLRPVFPVRQVPAHILYPPGLTATQYAGAVDTFGADPVERSL